MNKALEKALKAKGWSIGDAADFLGMSDELRERLDRACESSSDDNANQPAMEEAAVPKSSETRPAPPG